jgi:hypothetical protein
VTGISIKTTTDMIVQYHVGATAVFRSIWVASLGWSGLNGQSATRCWHATGMQPIDLPTSGRVAVNGAPSWPKVTHISDVQWRRDSAASKALFEPECIAWPGNIGSIVTGVGSR